MLVIPATQEAIGRRDNNLRVDPDKKPKSETPTSEK
jgi:hypothetical protein